MWNYQSTCVSDEKHSIFLMSIYHNINIRFSSEFTQLRPIQQKNINQFHWIFFFSHSFQVMPRHGTMKPQNVHRTSYSAKWIESIENHRHDQQPRLASMTKKMATLKPCPNVQNHMDSLRMPNNVISIMRATMVSWPKNFAPMAWFSTITVPPMRNAIYHSILIVANGPNYVSITISILSHHTIRFCCSQNSASIIT